MFSELRALAYRDFVPQSQAAAIAQSLLVAWDYRKHYRRRGSLGRNLARQALKHARAIKQAGADNWQPVVLTWWERRA